MRKPRHCNHSYSQIANRLYLFHTEEEYICEKCKKQITRNKLKIENTLKLIIPFFLATSFLIVGILSCGKEKKIESEKKYISELYLYSDEYVNVLEEKVRASHYYCQYNDGRKKGVKVYYKEMYPPTICPVELKELYVLSNIIYVKYTVINEYNDSFKFINSNTVMYTNDRVNLKFKVVDINYKKDTK